MKKLIAIFSFLFLLLGVNAQQLIPFKGENGKMGYKDLSGKEIVAPKMTLRLLF